MLILQWKSMRIHIADYCRLCKPYFCLRILHIADVLASAKSFTACSRGGVLLPLSKGCVCEKQMLWDHFEYREHKRSFPPAREVPWGRGKKEREGEVCLGGGCHLAARGTEPAAGAAPSAPHDPRVPLRPRQTLSLEECLF